MSLRRTTYDVGVILGALRVPYVITSVVKNITTQYVIEDFGVVISIITPGDYTLIRDRVDDVFKNYSALFISEKDNLNEKRYDIIWTLMQSGYMKWLRMSFTSQFPNILDAGNLGNLIIDERLHRWDNKPKFKYLIQDNLEAKDMGFRRMLSHDPSFFDYMP